MEGIRHLIRLLKVFSSYMRKDASPGFPPLKLWIETTSRCNLTCISCPNRQLPADEKKDMDTGIFEDIIDQAAGLVYEANLFHRGEPLLHPRIAHMVAYAAKRSVKTNIHTNAVLLDKKLGKDLITAGLDSMTFSIDSMDPDVYKQKRRGADLGKILENIRVFLHTRKRLGKANPEVSFQLMEDGDRMTVSGYKHKILDTFTDLSPFRIVVRQAHNWGGLLDDGSPVPAASTGICTFPWYSLTIFPDGRVYPCPQDFMGAMPAGDLKEQTLQEIFSGSFLTGLRHMFAEGRISSDLPCYRCDRIRRRTFMGIPVEYGRMFLRDHLRFRNKLVH
jgi:MoaA/NifB/PqqE/SkfB family radical SAM enzyme